MGCLSLSSTWLRLWQESCVRWLLHHLLAWGEWFAEELSGMRLHTVVEGRIAVDPAWARRPIIRHEHEVALVVNDVQIVAPIVRGAFDCSRRSHWHHHWLWDSDPWDSMYAQNWRLFARWAWGAWLKLRARLRLRERFTARLTTLFWQS